MTANQMTPAEQLAADIETLRRAKAQAFNKRTWRGDLSIAWGQGNYSTFGWRDMAGELQRIRNSRGPSWLHRVSLAVKKA